MQTVKKVQCDVDEKFGIASDLLHKLQQDIPLELVKNLKMVESFIKHIKHSQHVKNNCGALYLMSFIKAAKFLHARESLKIMMRWIGLSDLRALQNQHNREHAVLEYTKGTEKRRPFWPQFQELTQSLRQKFEDELDIRQKARLHMNFTLLLLFAINPGPAKQFRTLRIPKYIQRIKSIN